MAAHAAQDGVLVSVDLTEPDRAELRGLPNADVVELLDHLARITQEEAPRAGWVRTAWTRYEGVLLGPRRDLVASAGRVARALSMDACTGRLAWLVVLTRIFPGHPERTLYCDANYDLAKLEATSLVWVEPYPENDWQESQRYPSVEVIV